MSIPAERLSDGLYVQTNVLPSLNGNGHGNNSHYGENVFGADFEVITANVSAEATGPAQDPILQYHDAIQLDLARNKRRINRLFPGAKIGLDYNKFQARIQEDKEARKREKQEIRNELVVWLKHYDPTVRVSRAGKPLIKETSIDRAARGKANRLMQAYTKDPSVFAQMAGELAVNGDQQARLAGIGNHIDNFRGQGKLLNRKHRRAAYFIRDTADLLIWDDYITNQARIDRNLELARAYTKVAPMRIKGPFNYYQLSSDRKNALQQELSASKEFATYRDIQLLIPEDILKNKRGRDRLRRELVEFVTARKEVTVTQIPHMTLDHVAADTKKVLWAIAAALGVPGSLGAVFSSLDSILHKPTNDSNIPLRSESEETTYEVEVVVTPAEPPSVRMAGIASENVVVEIDAMPQVAHPEIAPDQPTVTAGQVVDDVLTPDMVIPRAADTILIEQQLTSFDPTIQLSPPEIPVPKPQILPKVAHIEAFGNSQPPTEVALPAGSYVAAEVVRHMNIWMAKLSKEPTSAQIEEAVRRALNDSKVVDPHSLPIGFKVNLSGVNEVMARAIAENPVVVRSVVQEAPVRAPKVSVAAAEIGRSRLGITQQEIESLRLIRDGRRYSCMELLPAIEASFADLGRGAVVTMNAVTASESSCILDAVSYAGSEGSAQIHRGTHQEWIERVFRRPFSEVVRNPWTAFKAARKIFDDAHRATGNGFQPWDVCGLPPKTIIKPVVNCWAWLRSR